MIYVAGRYVNPAFIASAGIETTHYMNGSKSELVVRMASGEEIRKEHWGSFNAFEELKRIDEATQAKVSP